MSETDPTFVDVLPKEERHPLVGAGHGPREAEVFQPLYELEPFELRKFAVGSKFIVQLECELNREEHDGSRKTDYLYRTPDTRAARSAAERVPHRDLQMA